MNNSGRYIPGEAVRARELKIRGIDYHISEWGEEDAPLLVYLHGWADTGSTFQFVVDALSSKWRVIAPDWRGFGRTKYRSKAYWFPDYLADLDEILRHYSPDAPVRLVGHSMGGNIGSLYAGSMPERVSAIANVEGFGLADSSPTDAPGRYRYWLESSRQAPTFATYTDFDSLAARIRKRSPGLSANRAEFVARQWACRDGDSIRILADPSHKLPNPVLYRRAEAEACWRNIEAHVLLVCGSDSDFARQFGEIEDLPFANSECRTIPGSGHMIHFEAAEQLAGELEKFFKKTL